MPGITICQLDSKLSEEISASFKYNFYLLKDSHLFRVYNHMEIIILSTR